MISFYSIATIFNRQAMMKSPKDAMDDLDLEYMEPANKALNMR
jgi:hypothetical protein